MYIGTWDNLFSPVKRNMFNHVKGNEKHAVFFVYFLFYYFHCDHLLRNRMQQHHNFYVA